MSTKRIKEPIESPTLLPSNNPEDLFYYTFLFESTYRVIQEALYDMTEIKKAVSRSSCREYLEFRRAIHNCLFYFKEISDTSLEDFFTDG